MNQSASVHPYGGRVAILAGPPCAGKGTQCKRLADELGLVHISTGDLFRDHVARETELGIQAKEFVERGCFVPDEIVIRFVEERVSQPDVAERGCLLDGFPRTADQAHALTQHIDVFCLILLQVPEAAVATRAKKRRIDPETGVIYNLQSLPPPEEVASRLVQRDFDGDDGRFRLRVDTYSEQIKRILPYFSGKVRQVDGTLEPDEVFTIVKRLLSEESAKTPSEDASTQATEAPTASTVASPEDDEWPDDLEPEEEQAISIQVAPAHDIGQGGGETRVMVSVNVPDSVVRVPTDVCCVVDISFSMSVLAVESDGVANKDGLSVLDIVKHALKMVIHSLNDDDRLSLVAFDNVAETAFELSPMTREGREQALTALEKLTPRGQTNIWAGIHAGMESLRVCADITSGRQKALLLLTDGQPNMVPSKGHLAEVRDYMDSHPGFSFQMNTFGFGYNLDSELLHSLAVAGHGTYAFIPDAVIVGTVFVNCIANVLSTKTQNATLNLMAQNGAQITGSVLGCHAELNETWGCAVSLGPLQKGQSRDVVIPMRIAPGAATYLEVVLTYPCLDGSQGRASALAADRGASQKARVANLLNETVDAGYSAVSAAIAGHEEDAQQLVKIVADRVAAASDVVQQHVDGDVSHGLLLALKSDTEGRMTKALQGMDRFKRWGKHYLRALMRAHQLQLCTNFMDPGVQLYGGTLFRELREKGDTIYLSLPAPKPSVATQRRSSAPAQMNRPNMNTYHAGAGGGCFGKGSTVQVLSSSGNEVTTLICNVRRGDQVRVATGYACVRCVACIARSPTKTLVTLPGGLAITPRHPVRINGSWCLPTSLGGEAMANPSGHVYNLVLDRCHVLLVDGIECVTWGHEIEGPVVGHLYFGSNRIISDLEGMRGWKQGFVNIEGCVRDMDGQVIGLKEGPGPRQIADSQRVEAEVQADSEIIRDLPNFEHRMSIPISVN